jgi:hypothetical protein
MEFEDPEGRSVTQKDYAEWSDSSASSEDDEPITGYIIISRPRVLKKIYKEILTEEELIS